MNGKSFYAIGVALFLACACAQAYEGSAEKTLHPTLTPDTGSTMTTDYPPGATLELPELSEDEERKIAGLIKDKLKNYTGIGRAIQVDDDNWAQVGEKNGFAIWQLHIHSPGSLAYKSGFLFLSLWEICASRLMGWTATPSVLSVSIKVAEITTPGVSGQCTFLTAPSSWRYGCHREAVLTAQPISRFL